MRKVIIKGLPLLVFSAVVISLLAFTAAPDEVLTNSPKAGSGPRAAGFASRDAYGDILLKGCIGDASVLLPVLASDSPSLDIARMIYNGLVKYDKDLRLVGDLAETWEISQDKSTIRFHLRKDVKWHDGNPFTAKDVEYTYRVCIDPKTPTPYASDFLHVKQFRALDDYTVEIAYHEPYAPALESWAQPVLPRHLLEGEDITRSPLQQEPVGTGPYKFAEWKTGEKIVLDANPAYFGGRPRISRVLTQIVPDTATMFLLLKAGFIDWMELAPLQYRRQTDTEWFRKTFRKYSYLGFAYNYLGYNLKDPKFKDRRVRQALTMAIDRESIVQGVLLGLGQVAHGPYKPDTFWYNPNVRKLRHDPEKAKELLAEAGWKDTDGDGVIDSTGMPFEFTILTNQGNPVRKMAATIIQSDLKKVGIKVNIRVLEWACFLKHFIHRRNFEAYLMGWKMPADPNQIDIWNSRKTGEYQLNHVAYKNEEVDRLLDLGVSTFDRYERKKYYDRFQEILAEDQPYTFLWYAETLPIVHVRVQGIQPAPAGIDYNFDKWFVPRAEQKYQITP